MRQGLHFRRVTASIVLLAIAAAVYFATTISAQTVRVATSSVTIIDESADSLHFRLDIAKATLAADGRLTIAGLDASIAEIGSPALPVYQTHIALPPEADVTVSVKSGGIVRSADSFVRPNPSVVIPDDIDRMQIRSLETFERDYTPNATIYESDALFPSALYEISEPQYSRDRRIATLTLYPVQYNPVTQQLVEHTSLEVVVTFSGSNTRSMQPANSASGAFGLSVLNSASSAEWRSLPRELTAANTATVFPIGVETVKIKVTEDAIYELSYDDLSGVAGFANGTISTFKMMHNASPVAFELVGDDDDTFESGESIRFYGWAFDGTRAEKHHVDTNIFWLWAQNGGSSITHATMLTTTNTIEPGASAFNSWESTLTFEEDNYWFSTKNSNWSTSDADPTVWYWQRFLDTHTPSFNLHVPHPTRTGTATYVVEVYAPISNSHVLTPTFNGINGGQETAWTEFKMKRLVRNLDATNLISGTNTLQLASGSSVGDAFNLNQIQLTYERETVAVNNQLQFDVKVAGDQVITVSGFANVSDVSELSVYNITNRLLPTEIVVTTNPTGGQLQIGHNSTGNDKLIIGKPKTPTFTTYTATTLEPNSGAGAQWIAVAPDMFSSEAQTLANHRATQNSISTFVADYEDIINQYGYGLATPAALQNYFKHGLTWANALEYVVLAGDATNNPLGRACDRDMGGILQGGSGSCPGKANLDWQTADELAKHVILTDYQFIDSN